MKQVHCWVCCVFGQWGGKDRAIQSSDTIRIRRSKKSTCFSPLNSERHKKSRKIPGSIQFQFNQSIYPIFLLFFFALALLLLLVLLFLLLHRFFLFNKTTITWQMEGKRRSNRFNRLSLLFFSFALLFSIGSVTTFIK